MKTSTEVPSSSKISWLSQVILKSAADEESWNRTLHELISAFNLSIASIHHSERSAQSPLIEISSKHKAPKVAGYDPIVQKFLQTYESDRTTVFLTDYDLIARSSSSKVGAGSQGDEGSGACRICTGRLSDPGSPVTMLVLGRAEPLGSFSENEIQIFRSVAGDISRDFQIFSRNTQSKIATLSATLNSLGLSAIIVDALGRVCATTERLSQNFKEFRFTIGKSVATASPALEPQIKRLLEGLDLDGVATSAAALSKDDGRRIVLRASALTGANSRILDQPAFVVTFSDPSTRMEEINKDLLKELFGITSAEARIVASSSQGKSIAQIANDLNLSPLTVRNHMMSIFEKTGVRRQADLIALLSRLSG